MKVLIVTKLYSPWIGGVEKIAQQIAEGLNQKDNIEVDVLCCQPKGPGRKEIINGVETTRASSLGMFWGMPVSFSFLRLFLKLSKRVDIVSFHHPFPLGDLAIFLVKPKAKLIVHYHSDIVRQETFSFITKPLVYRTLRRADKIVVSNPNLLKNSPYLKKFQDKVTVSPYGVDIKKFRPHKAGAGGEVKKIKEKYGRFVLFVGRLVYYKGLEYLVKAIRGVEANLVIIGEGPLQETLKNTTRRQGVEDKVFFLPHLSQKELVHFYQACSVFILPSIFRSEAFGVVLIEAMACGKPVVSTELGTGTSWVNVNRETGFVVPPRDSQGLASAIKKILKNKNLAQKFGQNALKRAREQFLLSEMIKGMSDLYGGI